MQGYTLTQWIFFFLFYCFVGWCIESSFVSFRKHKFVNRGFVRGPFIPLYGCGAIMMLMVSGPFIGNPVLVFFAGMVGATILEYITGVLMEALFKVRYWDYSNQPFNFQGHVCLGTSVAWGGLTLVLNYFLHKPIENLALSMSQFFLAVITYAVLVLFIIDFTLAFKAAFDLRTILVKMESAKAEMQLMSKRLDVIIAVINDEADTRLDKVSDKLEEVAASVEDKLTCIKEKIPYLNGVNFDKIKEEYYEIKGKFSAGRESHFGLNALRDFYKRGIVLGNPTMVSKKFKDAVEAMKKYVEEKDKKK